MIRETTELLSTSERYPSSTGLRRWWAIQEAEKCLIFCCFGCRQFLFLVSNRWNILDSEHFFHSSSTGSLKLSLCICKYTVLIYSSQYIVSHAVYNWNNECIFMHAYLQESKFLHCCHFQSPLNWAQWVPFLPKCTPNLYQLRILNLVVTTGRMAMCMAQLDSLIHPRSSAETWRESCETMYSSGINTYATLTSSP